jgi:hypothetical protein
MVSDRYFLKIKMVERCARHTNPEPPASGCTMSFVDRGAEDRERSKDVNQTIQKKPCCLHFRLKNMRICDEWLSFFR